MSVLLAKTASGPILHMSTASKTITQMEGAPHAGTTFHSDLPYVFIKKQWDITSYTTLHGGRKFAIPADLKSYKIANPDLAYLIQLTDSSGRKWIHDPMLMVLGAYYRYFADPWTVNQYVLAVLGGEYTVSYTASDAETISMSQNTIYPTISWTFRTWDSSDNHIVVHKPPVRNARSHHMYHNGNQAGSAFTGRNGTLEEYFVNEYQLGGGDIRSIGQDVVAVKVIFLNVTHSATTFNMQPGGNPSGNIDITPNKFQVGGLDLTDFAPLINHGVKTSGSIVSDLYGGSLASSKLIGTGHTTGKISAGGTTSGGGSAAVIEIPPAIPTTPNWDIDFSNRTILRGGVTVFNDSADAYALFALGSRTITFNPSFTLTGVTATTTVSSTQSGSIGAVASNTMYLASVVSGGNKLHSTTIMSTGDNMIMLNTIGYRNTDNNNRWASDIKFYLNISASGVITVKRYIREGTQIDATHYNTWANIASVALTLPEFTIRLISLGSK